MAHTNESMGIHTLHPSTQNRVGWRKFPKLIGIVLPPWDTGYNDFAYGYVTFLNLNDDAMRSALSARKRTIARRERVRRNG